MTILKKVYSQKQTTNNYSAIKNIETSMVQIKFNLLVRDAIINHLDSEGIDNVQFAQKEGRIKFTQR